MWAHVLTSLVTNLISLVIVVLVAVAMGFRSGAGALAWLAVTGILVLFTMALTWIAVIAWTANSAEGARRPYPLALIFLPFISSAFVPTRTMPGPVRAFADNQPVTSIVNTIRDLTRSEGDVEPWPLCRVPESPGIPATANGSYPGTVALNTLSSSASSDRAPPGVLNCSTSDNPSLPLGPVRFSVAPAMKPRRVSLLVSEATGTEGFSVRASQALTV